MRKRDVFWTIIVIWMIAITMVCSPSIVARAAADTKDGDAQIKILQTTEASSGTVSEGAVAAKTTEFCLYKGQRAEFVDLPSERCIVDNPDIVSISGKIVQALSKGIANIYVENGSGSVPFATITVKENENLTGVTFSKEDYPAVMAGTKTFCVSRDEFRGYTCRYTSLNTQIVIVDDQGIATPLSAGQTSIYIEVTDGYGGVYEYEVPIQVLSPHFQSEKICLAKNEKVFLKIADTGGAVPRIVSSNSKVSVEYSDESGVMIKAVKKGSAVVTATAEGATYTCKVTVTDPRMKRQYGFYEKNKSFNLSLSGKKSGSVLKWYSEDKKIATVTGKGKVRTKKMGSTVIACVADGRTLKFYLAVSTRIAVKAMRFGYTQVGKKHYSQARRMSKNYYDCSSFVYRSYRAAGKYLVRRTNWAPVAAEIGQYYVRKGRQVKCSGKTYNWNKLRPGDLVCFGGYLARRNGRYKRIYHIVMYIGNGKTLESSSLFNNVAIRDREPLTKRSVPVIVRPT